MKSTENPLKAIYRNGGFFPDVPCDLPEDSHVELLVRGLRIPPGVTDEEARRAVLQRIVQRMQANRWPECARQFSRDELHERR